MGSRVYNFFSGLGSLLQGIGTILIGIIAFFTWYSAKSFDLDAFMQKVSNSLSRIENKVDDLGGSARKVVSSNKSLYSSSNPSYQDIKDNLLDNNLIAAIDSSQCVLLIEPPQTISAYQPSKSVVKVSKNPIVYIPKENLDYVINQIQKAKTADERTNIIESNLKLFNSSCPLR